MKITTTIAKVLANETYKTLAIINSKKNGDLYKARKAKLEADPLLKELKLAEKKVAKLRATIKKKHKCSQINGWNGPSFNNIREVHTPSVETIKNDLLLMSWSNNEQLDSETLINELVKKYTK